MLDDEELRWLIGQMWRIRLSEQPVLDTIHGYMLGELGWPKVPEGSENEIQDLAALSIKNVLPLVRDAFAQNLCVVGYRDALAKVNDVGWESWQANRMDSRQQEVYRPAITYGVGYVIVTKGDDGSTIWRPRSPRQLIAVYEDPQSDEYPQYAVEMWTDYTGAKPHKQCMFYDSEFMYPVDLGETIITSSPVEDSLNYRLSGNLQFGEPYRHGADHCPVVRFVNGRDADEVIIGEIAPLLTLQRALNSVNFDSLIVGRFAAFPAKVITGWSASPSDVLEASARRVWAFEDTDVKAQSLPAADLTQYDTRLTEMLEFIATVAQISPSRLNPKLSRVSADALAAAEANEQRKTLEKINSFGESWEQAFRLDAEVRGDTVTREDNKAEVVWRESEVRSFAAVVDGITKLAAAGIPIEQLIDMIPGITQAKVESMKVAARREQAVNIVAALSKNTALTPTAAATDVRQLEAPPGPDRNTVE
jgi:hypothetical protein